MVFCIDLVGVSKRYQVGNVTVPALDNIDLHIGDGEFVVILGASRSGKTTMLNLIGALDKPTSGTLSINGRDITDASRSELFALRRETVSFVFQSFNLFPGLTAMENVDFASTSLARAGAKGRSRFWMPSG